MKLKSSPWGWLAAFAMVAAGLAHGSDRSPAPCTAIVMAQETDAEASVADEQGQRTESVTLVVRGMMKSRSGAT